MAPEHGLAFARTLAQTIVVKSMPTCGKNAPASGAGRPTLAA
jgi:hypothetical protein